MESFAISKDVLPAIYNTEKNIDTDFYHNGTRFFVCRNNKCSARGNFETSSSVVLYPSFPIFTNLESCKLHCQNDETK